MNEEINLPSPMDSLLDTFEKAETHAQVRALVNMANRDFNLSARARRRVLAAANRRMKTLGVEPESTFQIEKQDLKRALVICKCDGWETDRCLLAQAAIRQHIKHPHCDVRLSNMGAQHIAAHNPQASTLMNMFDKLFSNRRFIGTKEDVEKIANQLPIQITV